MLPPGGRISGARLARLLGEWRRGGARHCVVDLVTALKLLVADGRLPVGTRLPSERELTEALPVSRTTITAALDQLRAEGVVQSRRGAGSWINGPVGAGGGITGADDTLIDLSRAAPRALPSVRLAMDVALGQMPEHLASHGYDERGLPVLRQRIADRYAARGLPTSPDQIVVTSGAQHAWALVLRLFAGPGDRVLVEQPSYPNALEAVRASFGIPVPVPMLADGWDLDGFEAALRQAGPRLAYLIPDFQNPTGLRMSSDSRERLSAVLRKARTPLVVDETLVELALDSAEAPLPMAAFGGDSVVTLGSASKSHWGGLRIGWIRASAEIVHRLLSTRAAIDLGTPVFEQLVLAALLESPESVLRQRRAEALEQRDVAVAALREHCPQWSFEVPAGGLGVWCTLDGPVSTRIAVVAQNHGLRLVPGPRFAVHGGCEQMLRVPYTQSSEVLREAIARLGVVAASLAGTGFPADADLSLPVA
ncbi:DNA-binding transcriptional regulator, MocR family, contains an aminotransferase domain [Lentzea albidocapillata subsp. violacea]|uniref:DNA-binding transcriptional regulator, MocR family, contains an aminotransferase domain n=1 Tax=Lentzea albidocapillata subsp. violacea TaxID=128104 RepID=A0A1G9LIA4_9PSEU|nr:PLP-dependent aminotransferase family protein [Lentzea albidocapillata]SDL61636.1 DNA-binding transcriptional regulator, MocR family, contains an aminotransferase domain [Lentzea albidocapillata subsp. violacea]